MKKLLLILTFIMTLTLASCQNVNHEIPLVLYDESDPFIYQFRDHILYHSKGILDIEVFDAQQSQIIQNEIMSDLFLEKPQVIMVNPVDRLGAYTLIDEAKKENIPLVFFNREPLEADMQRWNQVYYVGAKAENSAILQAEMVEEIFGDPDELSVYDKNNDNIIQLVILKGEQGHQDAEIRTDIVVESLESYGYQLEIISIEICNWRREIAYENMQTLIKASGDEIELVISNNDYMALGAIDALSETELLVDTDRNGIIDMESEPWIPVLGIDGIDEAIPYMDSNFLYGTVINDSETMSLALIELVQALINGTNLEDISYAVEDGKYIWVDYKRYEN